MSRIISGDEQGRFLIQFPYDAELVHAVKAALPLAMWDRKHKVWTISSGAWREVQAFAASCQFSLAPSGARLVTHASDRLVASRATDAACVIPCPEGLAYLPFQKAGIVFASTRPTVLLADEMGLGKTVQAIGLINLLPEIERVLVICPASLKLNWAKELNRWLTRPLSVGIAGAKHLTMASITIINYDILSRHEGELTARTFDLIIADECHFIKNPKTKRAQQVFGLTGKRKAYLTGTPIVNRPKELFPLLSQLDPLNWPSPWKFKQRYCGLHHNGFGWVDTGATNLEELQDRLRSTIMVRRLKKDVLTELPPKRRQIIELPVPGAKASLVEAEHAFYEAREDRMATLRAAVELARVSDEPGAFEASVGQLRKGMGVDFAEMSKLRRETALLKLPDVLAHLDTALEESSKIVVFAHHREVLQQLAAHFGPDGVLLYGDTPLADRQRAVDRFQTDDRCRIFIASILAAGVGITLTASSHVVFAELDWVPGNVTQAEDRCHRIGQADSVLIQHLVLAGSTDATMARTIVAKQAVIDRALDVEHARVPILPVLGPTPVVETLTKRDLDADAQRLTEPQIVVIHAALRTLAAYCDDARSVDGQGFSKIDVAIGKSLAATWRLTPKQAALGQRIAWKYRRQLPETLVTQLEVVA
jgi:hypothetical protein